MGLARRASLAPMPRVAKHVIGADRLRRRLNSSVRPTGYVMGARMDVSRSIFQRRVYGRLGPIVETCQNDRCFSRRTNLNLTANRRR